MPINMDLLKQAQTVHNEKKRREKAEYELEQAEIAARAINWFIDWLKPLGITPETTAYGSGKPYVYSDRLTFSFEERATYQQSQLTITGQETGKTEYVPVWWSNPNHWRYTTVSQVQAWIMDAIEAVTSPDGSQSDDEPVPFSPCWYGAISEIEIEDEPDSDEDDFGPFGEDAVPEPARYLGMDDDEYEAALKNEPPAELHPPQESFIPALSKSAAADHHAHLRFGNLNPPAPSWDPDEFPYFRSGNGETED